MSSLMQEMGDRARRLGVPFSVQLDLTYRCNEQCVHCYLDHDDHGEMTTAEIKHLLKEMADAGVFILTLSGGEIFLRKDFFEILEYARALTFCIKLKTNAVLIGEAQAARLRELGVESIQISIYSHRPEVHDAITKVRGSLRRSIRAIRFLKSQGLKVVIANVLMTENLLDYRGVQDLATELGTECTLDPTITPKMDGDRSILELGAGESALRNLFRDKGLVGNPDEFCAPPTALDEESLENLPCSAGHTACYVSPYGEFYPCVQFPSVLRQCAAATFHRHLARLRAVERGPLGPAARSVELLAMRARLELHSLPWAGLPGREYARSLHRGLREIICPDRHSLS